MQLDNVLSNSPELLTGSTFLSDHINFYLIYLAVVGSDAVIRFASVIYARNIAKMVIILLTLLGKFRSSIVPVIQKRKKSCWAFLLTAIALNVLSLFNGLQSIFVLNFFRPEPFLDQYMYTLIPSNECFIRVLFFCLDMTTTMSNSYIPLFVIAFGLVLLEVHDRCIENFQRIIMKNEVLSKSCSVSINGEPLEPSVKREKEFLEEFKKDFGALTEAFRVYLEVSGIYLLALMFQTTSYGIRTVSLLWWKNPSTAFNETDGYFGGIVQIASGIIMANFGSYFRNTIDLLQQDFHNFLVCSEIIAEERNIRKTARWLLSWKWKLTALDYFEIDRSLILSISGTVLTYFIFIFQLKSSEQQHLPAVG
ncbi:unnamed protein product [Allacma fusca]|uniref:Uncharacterized protein n=1 Tax=Allacma fusca TaxID=39272 RepID=A0A8J2K1A9_9HEXA|nr:unnamed protein product [Allacma fusca]